MCKKKIRINTLSYLFLLSLNLTPANTLVLPITSISHLLAPYPQLCNNENCNDADNNNNNNNNNNDDDDDEDDDDDDDEDDDDDIDYVIPTEPCFNSS